ncbi:MAG TPA: phosphoribosyltransferase [Chloroflexota bacterium]
MQSYDYARRQGVCEISWDDFARLGARLAESLALLDIDIVVGVARAGLFPATLVACALRRELYPVRLTRRVNDEVVFASPVWRVPVPAIVRGQRVAVVDEIADTGETLRLVADEVLRQGARHVVTAALISHTWPAPPPDVTALVSDELIIFPWDRTVLAGGEWRTHPDLVTALAAQGSESGTRQQEGAW